MSTFRLSPGHDLAVTIVTAHVHRRLACHA
jgi:hypothetical protein